MKVLVDTCVWSIALKSNDSRNAIIVKELEALIDENRISMIGPIRQEILSAYKDENKFEIIKAHLSFFQSSEILDDDYIIAAKFHNICRGKGIQGSHIDFLICAISVRLKLKIFTLDNDFFHYQKYLPIDIHNTVNREN